MDLGRAPGGVTGAIFVATADLTEYIVKAPSLCSQAGPYIPANELIAAELATLVGVPALPWELIGLPSGDTGFGSLRMRDADFTAMTDTVADQVLDQGTFGDIAVFDLWIANTDRHRGNLLARRSHSGGYGLLANDHSHALVRAHMNPLDLSNEYQAIPVTDFFRCQQLRDRVLNNLRLGEVLDRVRDIAEDQVRNVVGGVPPPWLDDDAKQAVSDFLVQRARNIRSMMRTANHLFPNFSGVLP